MAGPEWDDVLNQALERLTGADAAEIRQAHARTGQRFNDIDERLYREWTSEAFFQYANDPANEVSPRQRYELRQAWFDYMQRLGYDLDTSEFWGEWREHMGYQ